MRVRHVNSKGRKVLITGPADIHIGPHTVITIYSPCINICRIYSNLKVVIRAWTVPTVNCIYSHLNINLIVSHRRCVSSLKILPVIGSGTCCSKTSKDAITTQYIIVATSGNLASGCSLKR